MESNEFIIRVFDEIGSESAISVSDGDALFHKIDKAITQGVEVVLDFQNINFIITAFFVLPFKVYDLNLFISYFFKGFSLETQLFFFDSNYNTKKFLLI